MRWSIRSKFLGVMSGLLLVCLGTYLLLAVTVFKSDKTQLVYDLNRSQVSNLASEIETQLRGVSEKLKLFAQLPPALQARMTEDLFSDDSEIVAVQTFPTAGARESRSHVNAKFLETYGLDPQGFAAILGRTPVPVEAILKDGDAIWNASEPGAPPLIGFGRLVILQDAQGRPVDQWAVVAYVKLDRLLKSVTLVSLSEIAVANRHGDVLVEREARRLAGKPSLQDNPVFAAAARAKTRISVATAEFEGQRWLTAYARALGGQVIVTAKAPEAEVFRVVRELTVRTLLFGSIVLTLVILAAFLLSRSLTRNIALLTERMGAVSRGDLSSTLELKGRDETVALAASFNHMIHDLKVSRDELERMNRELDQKVKERTEQLEIQNLKVKEAQEALLRTTRMASVGEIAGRTAHEVLNPLTSLMTRAGLMQTRVKADYEDRLQVLEEIRRAWARDFDEGGFEKLLAAWRQPSTAQPGKTLFEEDVENLRLIARELGEQGQSLAGDMGFIREEGARIAKIIDSMRRLGHAHREARAQSCHALLDDCCDIMADLFDQKGFRIERELKAARDLVNVDRDELIQAVTNLMRNSLQAMSAKGRMIVRTRNEAGEILVEIEDDGAGIAPEHQARLFEASFTTKSADEGTGLGLGISRRFARAYGGDIEFVSSRPGRATVFRIRLPLHQPKTSTGSAA